MDRLEAEIRSLDMQVFIRIDHAAGAAQAGMELGPTELILFGNVRAGTPLMQMGRAVGLDLPLKALVWQDAAGKTWLTYLPPAELASRNGLGERGGPDRWPHDGCVREGGRQSDRSLMEIWKK